MPRFWFLLLAALLPAASPPKYSVKAEQNVRVPMRDGVALAADVYLPDTSGRFPTVLYRTPYNKAGLRSAGNFFAARGYAVVAQDVRGRFESAGDFYAFVNEGPDGYDAIEWVARQPWSNGQVVTDGASYLAWDQYHAAMYRPPHLQAMFANVGGNNFYREFAYPGGVLNLGWSIWILRSAQTSNTPAPKDELTAILRDPTNWFRLPVAERGRVLDAFPAHRRMFDDFYAHPEFDSEWRRKGFFTEGGWKQMKDVPTLFISGWYDYFAEGAIENFVGLRRRQTSPQSLWLGPWPHGIGGSGCGDVSFGYAAALDPKDLALDWFDRSLKRANPNIPTVRWFRMGGGDGFRDGRNRRMHGGRWFTADSWPPPNTSTEAWYLAADGKLTRSRPEQESEPAWRHDPSNPVPSLGGRYTMVSTIPPCVQDQSPLDARSDVLRFVSEPLSEPLEVTGRIQVTLHTGSTARQSDFTAKLIDLYPDNYAMILLDGIQRVAFEAGKPNQAVIDLGTTSNLFAKGHRIRLDISSSNWPRAEVHPDPARNRLYLGGSRPSQIALPTRRPPAR
jgi:putative CocE/NonD family hydrolase